ncbi:MAG: flagellar motor switch protein FliN [Solirubrobacteraceae bacterium]|nr:flagellar motor switch protein FliN [Solirubrobacteraceae bacterium]
MQTTDWTADTELGGDAAGPAAYDDLARLHGVPVELAVEIGRTTMTLGQALQLGPGSIVELRRLAGEPVDLLAGGRAIARGEVVVVDGEFGLRITEMVVDGDARPAPADDAPPTAEADASAGPTPFGAVDVGAPDHPSAPSQAPAPQADDID